MKVLSPFGPKIASLKISTSSIRKINNEVDKIISKKNLLKKLDYSNKLVGQVRQEFQLPKKFIKKNLEKILFKAVKNYIFKSLGKKFSHQEKWKKSIYEVYKDAEVSTKWTSELKEFSDKIEIDFFSL